MQEQRELLSEAQKIEIAKRQFLRKGGSRTGGSCPRPTSRCLNPGEKLGKRLSTTSEEGFWDNRGVAEVHHIRTRMRNSDTKARSGQKEKQTPGNIYQYLRDDAKVADQLDLVKMGRQTLLLMDFISVH